MRKEWKLYDWREEIHLAIKNEGFREDDSGVKYLER